MQPMGRNQGPRPKPVPVVSLREEPKIVDLQAKRDEKKALERADATFRTVFPTHCDGLGAGSIEHLSIEDVPVEKVINPELASLVIARVDDARAKLREAVELLDGASDASTRETIAEAEDCVSIITATLVVKWGAL
jgi:hypothetical protein